MLSEYCGSSLLLDLPDDVFAVITQSLSPKDVCNLSLCCRKLCVLLDSEKVWFTQCDMVGVLHNRDLVEWRKGVSSFRALCCFLVSVKPLIGIWVHQNPELGNVVYVMPGFLSVVGCRIIPQELGPLGIEDGPILWAPVFEVISETDGSTTFFLHGREKVHDYFCPGSVKAVERNCNVLLLEIEPKQGKKGGKLLYSKSNVLTSDSKTSGNICRSNSDLSRSQRGLGQTESVVPFSRLAFRDRRKLLEAVTNQARLRVPDSASGPLFPGSSDDVECFGKDNVLLLERRSLLLQLRKHGRNHIDGRAGAGFRSDPTQLDSSEIIKSFDSVSSGPCNSSNGDAGHTQSTKRKTLSAYFKASIKQIIGRSISTSGSSVVSRSNSSSSESKHAQLHEFLKSGETMGLTLHASSTKLSSYRAWPNMHDSRFALYKLPMWVPRDGQEYAGLWGGTFGWPPGRPTADKPGKALFFLLLSYEETEGQQLLIGTKILEGSHHVLHPNGSAMFVVNINEPSLDPFPWDTYGDSLPVIVENTFSGEGIAHGYGFRYPGSKPGSLFVIENGLLAFIWKESNAVLTLRRLNLEELLKKGERVPPLPPTTNFSYLTKSYSNVFARFSNASASPRELHT